MSNVGRMRQLNSLDAAFVAVESPTQPEQHGILFVLDPATSPTPLTLARVRELFAARLAVIAPLRWKLHCVPLALDYPYWLDDPNVDLEYHVREVALPQPATDESFAEMVSWLAGRPLDHTRHLWVAHLIHGLPQGRVALLLVVHHAAVDGAGVMDILEALSDAPPPVRDPPPTEAAVAPSRLAMWLRGLLGIGRYWLRVARVARRIRSEREHVQALRTEVTDATDRPKAPRLSFNHTPSRDRRWVFAQIPLADVLSAKQAHGCTLNDVIVSICAGAMRRWLIEHDELPPTPLLARVPVSTRSEERDGDYGNELSMINAIFFTDEADPAARLALTHTELASRKARAEGIPPGLAQDLLSLIPAPLCRPIARLARAYAHARHPAVNVGVANVPGPRDERRVLGAEVTAFYSVNLTPDGPGFVCLTVGQFVNFTIVVDRYLVADVWKLVEWVREELAALAPPTATSESAEPDSIPERPRG